MTSKSKQQLIDYSRFVSNGEDVGVDSSVDPKLQDSKWDPDRLLIWAETFDKS